MNHTPSRREILKSFAVLPLFPAVNVFNSNLLYANDAKGSHDARYWHKVDKNIIQCDLCPNGCTLAPGATGICRGRQNRNGSLKTLGYGYPCAIHLDPVEKKPLYHFLPGSKSFSIAIAGCSLRCKNCQNYTISQVSPLSTDVPYVHPRELVRQAVESGAQSIAYTYSEPTVWIEYMYDTAMLAKKANLKNILVSSGYVNNTPFSDLAPVIDAAHIDLKSFDDSLYKSLNSGTLNPVLDTIKAAKQKGIWVEIVNLVIPKWTDNIEMIRPMCRWIHDTTGNDTPLHFSRFFPMYQLSNLPVTSTEILISAQKIAREEKLSFVYIGNVPELDTNTYCPSCNTLLIERKGYRTIVKGITQSKCVKCKLHIPGIWSL
jgi:pyruvate formate lyase activating enzyme